jgi:hypothetical protein
VVAPRRRFESVWPDLLDRAQREVIHFAVQASPGVDLVAVNLSEDHVMAMTSWRLLLDRLSAELVGHDEHHTAHDVEQLRGLCEVMDRQAFYPLRPEELSAVEVPQRIMHYLQVVSMLADKAVNTKPIICGQKQLSTVRGIGITGRYLWLGQDGIDLTVHLPRWQHFWADALLAAGVRTKVRRSGIGAPAAR